MQMLGLEHVSIFRNCSEEALNELYSLLKQFDFKPGELIIKQGDPSKEMFFISKGKVDIINAHGVVVASINEGECFGEMGLVFSIPRTASVRAAGPVACFSLSKDDFITVRSKHPAIERQVQQIAKGRFYRFQEALYNLAATTSPGSDFTPDQLRMFSEVFYFWDRDNDNKLTKEETGEMMEAISGKQFSSGEIDSIIKMMDHDKDGVISFDDFRNKIWNLRWFIDPVQAKELAEKSQATRTPPEEEPFWGLHWAKGGCGESAQQFLNGVMAWVEHPERITTEGIYRLSGESKTVDAFKSKIFTHPQSYKVVLRTENLDVHCITGLVKLYLREMPEPLIPFDLYQVSISAYRTPKSQRTKKIIHVLCHLPEDNRRILKMLMRHLNKVTAFGKDNLMNPKNLAIIFAPTLLRPKNETPETLIGHSDSISGFIEKILKKPAVFLADDHMTDFAPSYKVEIVVSEVAQEAGKLDSPKKKKKKAPSVGPSLPERKSKTASLSPSPREPRLGRKSLALRRTMPDEDGHFIGDDKAELVELLSYMKMQTGASSPALALMAYKDIILSSTLAKESCNTCGHTVFEQSVLYCSRCGNTIKVVDT